MAQTIWIVRHGNREDFLDPNWSKNAARPHDPALSPDGEVQAREVGLCLRDQQVDRIVASPFLRTVQTASHIADVLDLPIRLEPGIGEILPNITEPPVLLGDEEKRLQFARIRADHPAVYHPSYPEPNDLALCRAGETVAAVADRHPDDNILFVTHAAPVVGIVRHLTNQQAPIRVPLCCIFTLERSEDGWRLQQNADISHLSDHATSLRHAHVG